MVTRSVLKTNHITTSRGSADDRLLVARHKKAFCRQNREAYTTRVLGWLDLTSISSFVLTIVQKNHKCQAQICWGSETFFSPPFSPMGVHSPLFHHLRYRIVPWDVWACFSLRQLDTKITRNRACSIWREKKRPLTRTLHPTRKFFATTPLPPHWTGRSKWIVIMECGANLVGEHGRTLTGYSRQWAGGQFDDFVISQKGLRIYLNECMVRSSKE